MQSKQLGPDSLLFVILSLPSKHLYITWLIISISIFVRDLFYFFLLTEGHMYCIAIVKYDI